MQLLGRLLFYFMVGYAFGTIPGRCAADAQVEMHEKITLSSKNTVIFRGVVNGKSITQAQFDLVAAVIARGSSNTPIYLVLDSPGGSIDAGLAFIEFAKTIPNLHTISIFSASMASAIAEQLPGQRLITNNGYLMFHRATGGFEGQFETGELETRLQMAKRLVLNMEQINAARMRMSIGDYKALVRDELWLDAKQSLEYRAADKIVDLQCTTELIKQTETVEMNFFIATVKLQFSKCPLFRAPISAQSDLFKLFTPSNYKSLGLKGLP